MEAVKSYFSEGFPDRIPWYEIDFSSAAGKQQQYMVHLPGTFKRQTY